MSFTSDTKKELINVPQDTCCEIASLSAMLAINGYLSLSSEGMRVVFQTTSLPLARKVIATIKKLYGVRVDVLYKKGVRLNKKNQYIVTVKERVMTIIRELGLMDEETGYAQSIDDTIIMKDCDKRAYLRGAFLASGSVNAPVSSSYHLEISVPHERYAESLKDLFNEFQLKAKTLKKKNHYLVYVKDSEKISDFLRIVDAHNALFNFEDERIKRDFVNSITRVMNMEIANQNKTFEAANRQLKQIEIVERIYDEDEIPPSVHEAIFLRKTYPEASLNELSELSKNHYNKQISKSGLNHRFRAIAKLANKAVDEYAD
ncbi:MAG: DNA-binding protein WhiA [Candidatus Izemoplasmataceae bacterium]